MCFCGIGRSFVMAKDHSKFWWKLLVCHAFYRCVTSDLDRVGGEEQLLTDAAPFDSTKTDRDRAEQWTAEATSKEQYKHFIFFFVSFFY